MVDFFIEILKCEFLKILTSWCTVKSTIDQEKSFETNSSRNELQFWLSTFWLSGVPKLVTLPKAIFTPWIGSIRLTLLRHGADRPTGRQTVHKPTFDLVVTKKTAMMNSIIGDARSIRCSGCRLAAVISPTTPRRTCAARWQLHGVLRYQSWKHHIIIRSRVGPELWQGPTH